MSSASRPGQGFARVRRGYRPARIDAFTAALSAERDAAWERAARLTVLAREMEADLELLRETVAQLPEQTYECLGEQARTLFALAREEAAVVRAAARREAESLAAEAEEAGRQVREAAQAYADEVRGEAEERVRTRMLAARAEADDVRVTARREVKKGRGEALAALREVRRRTEGLLAEQTAEQAEREDREKRAAIERTAALETAEAERSARAKAALAAAKRAYAEAEEAARRIERDAEARACEVIAEARVRADRIACETERVVAAHEEQREVVRAEMAHVRHSLSVITDRAPAE
ncbi:cellulose-binding protein [Streptomyces sp. RY43-2]|uniref:Cellulose-binding protein n=1 Tax=Streptomyces macrolidinus TaxID=2952607 RepID=A0ABT0ZEC5_9ACTN|nr:cellulose-binding protein [Streptomyces macrolidinus]MCN9241912.1 cellulose-binding protein [Streptomyces macrolidinus]